MKVFEHWTVSGSPDEHEVTFSVPAAQVPVRGSTINIPGVGSVSVMTAKVLRKGGRDVPDGEVVVRVDCTTEPGR
jgi:hypothetical protein